MLRKLIIFLVRKHLGLKLYEGFQFSNQKHNAVYYFTPCEILKNEGDDKVIKPSRVSLNWLLNDKCEIIRRGDPRWQD